jgi:phosphohistidine phosphatase SixA
MFKPFLACVAALSLLAGAAQAQTVLMVRHAEKAAEPAGDPPLTAAGQVRAEALSTMLTGMPIGAIISSDTLRTRSTAEPLSRRTGVAVTRVPLNAGLPKHLADTVAAVRAAPKDKAVVVVGHSNTVPEIARALGQPSPAPIADCKYDAMYVARLGGAAPSFAQMTYGAASAC